MEKIINLEIYCKTVEISALQTREEFKSLYFDYAGAIPENESFCKYQCTPLNSTVFASTGGDGVHYSILELTDSIQPVIMTVPTRFGKTINDYNCILAEHLSEFLSIGYFNGWFPLEQIYYANDWAIKFYQTEDLDSDYQSGGDVQFLRIMRQKLGYKHIPLNNARLAQLKERYFHYLIFDDDFLSQLIKRGSS